jgi:glycosyltransferase involved in cell wall biosynthesis
MAHQYVPIRSAGAETHLHAMLRALVSRGHHVDVTLSRQTGEPYVLDGVNVWPLVDYRADVFRWLTDADLLVAHLENTIRANVLGDYNGIPVVILHHNTFEQTRDALLLASARTDLLVLNSQWMTEDLIDWSIARDFQLPPRVLCRPVADPADYATTPGDRVTLINLRRTDGGSDNALTKGGEVFRAVAQALPEVDFLGVTGAYGRQQELDDLPNVEVIEHVPHDRMRELVYARTRVLLVPSSYESWGRVASEAITSGIPVVASPTPGLQECLGPKGVFIDPANIERWVDAVRTLTSNRRAWAAASKAMKDRAAEHAAFGDLERWCDWAEATAAAGEPVYLSEGAA